MSVAMQEQKVMISPDYVERCAAVIEKSGAHKMIDFYFHQDRGVGGRKSTGPCGIRCWACSPWVWL